MNTWSEDNFLEKLMTLERPQSGVTQDPCPDAATICSALEDGSNEWLRKAFADHVQHCAACAELQRRLQQFDEGGNLPVGAEWRQTEKRLHNWLEASLLRDAPSPQPIKILTAKRGSRRLPWAGSFWKLAWGLGAASIVWLGVGLFVTHRNFVVSEPEIASRQAPNTLPTQSLPSAEAAKSEANSSGSPQAPSTAETLGPRVEAKKPVPSIPHLPPIPYDVGAARTLGNVEPTPPEPRYTARALPPSGIGGGMHTAPAQRGPFRTSPVYQTSSTAPRPAEIVPAGPPSTHPAARPLLIYPMTVRLSAGTRLWIVLNSVARGRSNGFFTFRGTLLLPVSQGNAVTLERDTQVIGMCEGQGHISLSITEFVIRGVPYFVTASAGASTHLPAEGETVQFEAGKVLEMWLDTDATYDRSRPAPSK